MAYAEEIGFPDEIIGRGTRTANEPPTELVYAGFPPGVVSAHKFAQTRAGARGALLFYSCVPTSYFGPWPALLHPDAAALLTTRVLEYLGTR